MSSFCITLLGVVPHCRTVARIIADSAALQGGILRTGCFTPNTPRNFPKALMASVCSLDTVLSQTVRVSKSFIYMEEIQKIFPCV